MPQEASLVGMSFSVKANEGYYIPLNHTYLGVPQCLSLDKVREKLLPILNSSDVKIIGHNIKFDVMTDDFNIGRIENRQQFLSNLIKTQALRNTKIGMV